MDQATIEKIVLGKRLKDIVQVPTAEQITNRLAQSFLSKRSLRDIGWSENEGTISLSEEDRESHIHILGSPGEGKSKFLELLLRQDIDNGYGACLIDPSDNGDTAYKVLKYAISKGFEKIVLVEPRDIIGSGRVSSINPIHYTAPAPAVVGSVMDSCRILWGQGSFSDTPRIQKYLPAVITALHSGGFTIPDAECMMDRLDPVFKNQRNQLLYNDNYVKFHRLHHAHLVSAFSNQKEYDGYLPTINRLMPFMDPTMKLLFGSKTGLDFFKLITDGYIILVNLDSEGVWGANSPEQRLLGTIIINEIIYAISRLRTAGWKGVYYLYIDEAGDYATQKISYILDKKRKSGLRLTLSHQRFDQFSDKEVSSAVYGGTKIKVLFNTASREDRDKMLRMMYSGKLTEHDVTYAASQLRRRNAIIKVNKAAPVSTALQNIPDVIVPDSVVADFKNTIYASDFYRDVKQVRAEIQNRFVKSAPKQFRRGHGQSAADKVPPTAGEVADIQAPSGAAAGQPGRESFKTAFDTKAEQGLRDAPDLHQDKRDGLEHGKRRRTRRAPPRP